MKTFVNVGASIEAVREAREAIIEILDADVDQSTIVAALETLRSICNVNGTSITNSSFVNHEAKDVEPVTEDF